MGKSSAFRWLAQFSAAATRRTRVANQNRTPLRLYHPRLRVSRNHDVRDSWLAPCRERKGREADLANLIHRTLQASCQVTRFALTSIRGQRSVEGLTRKRAPVSDPRW